MSSKANQDQSHLTKRQRREAMARKREERAVRAEHKKEKKAQSYLADDVNFVSFSAQLASMGLKLRDIPGDGNCLFRALGDQIDGHSKNHLRYREEVVKFMLQNRADFEPFVEDDVPFDRHVANLKKPGTYAGNDAIVAFAKFYKLTVVIHQRNSPLWQIHGTDEANPKQIHISYHNGDHYSSVRRATDMSAAPTNLKLKADGTMENGVSANKSSYSPYNTYQNKGVYGGHGNADCFNQVSANYNLSANEDGVFSWNENSSGYNDHGTVYHSGADGVARAITDENSLIHYIYQNTGCQDVDLITESLHENYMDVDLTIAYILQIMATQYSPQPKYTGTHNSSSQDSGIWSESGTGSRIFGGTAGTKPKKQTAKYEKQQKKLDKKNRATERHKERLLGNNGNQNTSSYHGKLDSSDEETVIVQNVGALTI